MQNFDSIIIYLGVVKYKSSAFFWKLCDQSMSVHALSPSLRPKLFSKSSPNPNKCMHERSERAHTLIHGLQRFRKRADGLYLTTSIYFSVIFIFILVI